MEIAILADSHFGCRKNSSYFMNHQRKFYERFFDYLNERGIKDIIHLGDVFDNRKSINIETLRHTRDCFIDPIIKNGINLHMILGNHDHFYKSNGDLSSVKVLFSGNRALHIYDKPAHIYFEDKRFYMLPWVFPDQIEETIETLRTDTSDVLCAHLDILGAEFNSGVVSQGGINPDVFSHISTVYFGHFHKKSDIYVGSTHQITFNDLNDTKRIVIYDTDEGKGEDVFLSPDIFYEINYPEDMDKKEEIEYYMYTDKIVRVVVNSKKNLKHYDKFIHNLENVEPNEIIIKEKYLYVNVLNADDLDPDTDTLGMMLKTIDDMDDMTLGEQTVVKEIMSQLYSKASE